MIIAFDISDRLERSGYSIDGPYPSVARALEAIRDSQPDVAVLDVQLADGTVYPLADRLADLSVPIVFHSGHARTIDLTSRYPGAAVCAKPCALGMLEEAVSELVACGA